MSKLLRAYITKEDVTFKKVEGKDGVTYHFKDGKPVTENSFTGGLSRKKFDGQYVKVAIPSNKGPGYERVEINPIEASKLGQELRYYRDDVPGEPDEFVTIDGKRYETSELRDLNDRIANRHGDDALFKYR